MIDVRYQTYPLRYLHQDKTKQPGENVSDDDDDDDVKDQVRIDSLEREFCSDIGEQCIGHDSTTSGFSSGIQSPDQGQTAGHCNILIVPDGALLQETAKNPFDIHIHPAIAVRSFSCSDLMDRIMVRMNDSLVPRSMEYGV